MAAARVLMSATGPARARRDRRRRIWHHGRAFEIG
jgi:hypothetical protein